MALLSDNLPGPATLAVARASVDLLCLEGEVGGNNSGPYVEALHGLEYDGDTDNDGAWCAVAVSKWCGGVEAPWGPDPRAKDGDKLCSAGIFIERWAKREGAWIPAVDAKRDPSCVQPGDVCVFWRVKRGSWQRHVGVVDHVDAEAGVFWSVEGNVGSFPSLVGRERHSFKGGRLLGFVRPTGIAKPTAG